MGLGNQVTGEHPQGLLEFWLFLSLCFLGTMKWQLFLPWVPTIMYSLTIGQHMPQRFLNPIVCLRKSFVYAASTCLFLSSVCWVLRNWRHPGHCTHLWCHCARLWCHCDVIALTNDVIVLTYDMLIYDVLVLFKHSLSALGLSVVFLLGFGIWLILGANLIHPERTSNEELPPSHCLGSMVVGCFLDLMIDLGAPNPLWTSNHPHSGCPWVI